MSWDDLNKKEKDEVIADLAAYVCVPLVMLVVAFVLHKFGVVDFSFP